MQHFHRFGVRVVMRERVIQRVVAIDHLDPQTAEQFGRKGGCGAVPRGADDLELTGHFEVAHQIIQIGFAHAIDEFIFAAFALFATSFQHDIAQLCHLVRAVGQRAFKAHLHARPAIGVMRGGDHRHRRRIQMELREIGHGRQAGADILDVNTRLHQAQNQRIFNR